jgi:hypothetical protein
MSGAELTPGAIDKNAAGAGQQDKDVREINARGEGI